MTDNILNRSDWAKGLEVFRLLLDAIEGKGAPVMFIVLKGWPTESVQRLKRLAEEEEARWNPK
jgi:hypothetical protein